MIRQAVIGASGLLGGHLVDAIRAAGGEAIGTWRSFPAPGLVRLDLQAAAEVRRFLREHKPRIVYVPAALSNVDRCEQFPEESYRQNVTCLVNVAAAAEAAGAKLVYFSTDCVFNAHRGPYSETDPADPCNVYGRHKLCSEHYLTVNFSDALIIRTTVVFGWERQGKNFVYRALNALRAGQLLRAPRDQAGNPTYAPNLAAVTVGLAAAGARGIYHVAGPEIMDRAEFARRIARTFNLEECLVEPVETAELGQMAPRPLQAGLKTAKVLLETRIPLVAPDDALLRMRLSEADWIRKLASEEAQSRHGA